MDLLSRIVFVNIAVLIASLPIITIGPAFIAGYKQIRYYVSDREAPLFKTFIQCFKEQFLKHVLIGLITLISSGLLLFNLWVYFNHLINSVGYVLFTYLLFLFITIIIGFALLLIIVHIPLVCTYRPELKIKETIKFSLYMGLKNLLTSLGLIFIALLPLIIIRVAIPVFGFIGVGIPIWMSIRISHRIYYQYNQLL